MPFTLAHPVAILPFTKKWPRLPFSALVIGSMAPDFPYFLLIDNDYYHFGHSLRGVFEFCVPAGLIALALFHYVVKMPLLSLFPPKHIERLVLVARSFRVKSGGDVFVIVLALVIGAVSHIAVDSFTHQNGWIVRHIPMLASPIPIYKALQYGGSLGGLWLLCRMYGNWLAKALPDPAAARSLQRLMRPTQVVGFLSTLLIVSVCVGLAFSAIVYRNLGGAEAPKKVFADALESCMSAFALGLMLFSLFWHASALRQPRANE